MALLIVLSVFNGFTSLASDMLSYSNPDLIIEPNKGKIINIKEINTEKIKSIPEVHADFVFAGWAEAMGFLGIIGYFALLGYFAYKAFYIATKCEDFFRSLLAFGCGAIIVIQSLLNCGVVCGALPSTGIPLPFFSHGGSSMLITLAMSGVLINISRYENVSEMIYEWYLYLFRRRKILFRR